MKVAMKEPFKIEEITIGEKQEKDKIVFKSIKDMEEAYRDIDNGNDIYVEKDGYVTKLLHKMINTKIYEGKIQISARRLDGEQIGGQEK